MFSLDWGAHKNPTFGRKGERGRKAGLIMGNSKCPVNEREGREEEEILGRKIEGGGYLLLTWYGGNTSVGVGVGKERWNRYYCWIDRRVECGGGMGPPERTHRRRVRFIRAIFAASIRKRSGWPSGEGTVRRVSKVWAVRKEAVRVARSREVRLDPVWVGWVREWRALFQKWVMWAMGRSVKAEAVLGVRVTRAGNSFRASHGKSPVTGGCVREDKWYNQKIVFG